MFQLTDKIHLDNIIKLLRNNVKFDNLDVANISECYHALALVQGMSVKIDAALEAHRQISEFDQTILTETEGLRKYVEELEYEIQELKKKPVRKTRKKKS